MLKGLKKKQKYSSIHKSEKSLMDSEKLMMDSPDLSPGSSPWDTNRTNRTRSSGGKYESALFWVPAKD